MLTLDSLDMPLAALRLLDPPHRLALDTHHPRPAHKRRLIHPRRPAERILPAAEDRGAGQAQRGADGGVGHQEGEPQLVAEREQVGPRVDVGHDVVRGLGGEEGEEGEVGV